MRYGEFAVQGRTVSGIYVAESPRVWVPEAGRTGVVLVAQHEPLLAVIGGRVAQVTNNNEITATGYESVHGGEGRPVTLGGLVIMSGSRHKEPTQVIGHPDLASGASVQRGDTLYVSVAEAIYRESRGELVEVHLTPTAEDNAALSDLRARARHRWENDRLPDGWTRPLPPTKEQQVPMPKESMGSSRLSDELRRLAEDIKTRDRSKEA